MLYLYYNNSGNYYIYCKNDLPRSIDFYKQAVMYADSLNSPWNRMMTLGLLADVYYKNNNSKEAEKSIYELLPITEQLGMIDIRQRMLDILSKIKSENKDFKSAYNYLREAFQLRDSVFNENNQEHINLLETEFQTEKKELQIAEQEALIARQKTIRIALIFFMTLLSVILVLLWYLLHLRRKRALELSERNSILTEMNDTKDKFFSIISHDLRNPAIAQRDALQMLIRHSDTWDTETLSRFYVGLLNSAKSEVELLNNLLNWAQMQTGRMPFKPDTFELDVELKNEVNLIRNMAAGKDITFQIIIPEGMLVTADNNMLRTILTNAVKYTEQYGSISLIVTETGKNNCTIVISDTGVGMTTEQLENLFRISNQFSSTGTSGEKGTGLGLIICKDMLERHGSTLHVESEEGKGSKFWFTI